MRAVAVRVAIVRTTGLRRRRHPFGRSCRLSRFLGLRLRPRPVIAGASTRSGSGASRTGGEASRPAPLRGLRWCDEAPSVAARALLDGLNNGRPLVSVRRPSLRRCTGDGLAGCEGVMGGDRGAAFKSNRAAAAEPCGGVFRLVSLPPGFRTTCGCPVRRADVSDQALCILCFGTLPLNAAPSSFCGPLTRWPASSLRRCWREHSPRLGAIDVASTDAALALARVRSLPLLLLLLKLLLKLLPLLLLLLASSSRRPLSRASEPLLLSLQALEP